MREQFFGDQRCGGEVSIAVEDGGDVVDSAVDASRDLLDEELACFFFQRHAGEEVIEAILNAELEV